MSKTGILLASFAFSLEKGPSPQEFITTPPWPKLSGDLRGHQMAKERLPIFHLLYLYFQ